MPTQIIWGDGFIEINMPKIPEDLKSALRYWHRELTYDVASHRQIVDGNYRDLYSLDFIVDADQNVVEHLVTMPGFMHRIKTTFKELGEEFVVIDQRTPFIQPNINAALKGLRDYQWECAYTAIMSGGGVISCPTGWGKTHLIGAICRAFDYAELCTRNTPLTVVTCADKEIATQNYETLKQVLPNRDVGLIMSGVRDVSEDIQVITLGSMNQIKSTDIGILIVDEVHGAATPSRTGNIIAANKARIWGASATPTGRFDGGDLLTEGMIGPVIYQRTYQDGVQDGALVPIEVYWINCPPPSIGVDRYNRYTTRRGKYNQAVINGAVQNNLTVELLKRIPPELQTLCIMQQTAQMNNLVELMPGIRYIHAKTADKDLINARQHNLVGITNRERKKIYDDVRSGKIRQILSTHVYKQGVNFPDLSVIVCPGGGGSEIIAGQIPGRGSRLVKGKDVAYLIDFWHDWDLQPLKINERKQKPGPLLRDDRERDKVYENLGFQRTWVNSLDEIHFLNNRGSKIG